MKHDLAVRLLDRIVGDWGSADDDLIVEVAEPMGRLAAYKYDEYGGYSPGVKFMESLATWLAQMELAERPVALNYVKDNLIFISNREILHALRVAYKDHIRPLIIRDVGDAIGEDPWRLHRILKTEQFSAAQRRTLFLGLADGARLDYFRRASRDLQHDQFSVHWDISDETAASLHEKLVSSRKADTFNRLVLIDDFSGSGYTALSQREGTWGGKLWKVSKKIGHLQKKGYVADDVKVHVLLYVCTESAKTTLNDRLTVSGLNWDLVTVQGIPETVRIEDGDAFAEICQKYHDEVFDDATKIAAGSASAALGFNDGRLPLVLTHNTPNNSLGLLWQNSADHSGSASDRHALFPRHERHRDE